MRARRDAALRLLKTMLVASIVFPLSLFAYASWVNYEIALTRADEHLAGSLTILSEQALKVFQSVDLTFTSVGVILGDLSDEQIKASEQSLHLQLSKLEKAVNSVDAIVVADSKGRRLVSSAVFPVTADLGVEDRDYFLAHVDRDAGTFVGAVSQSRVTKELFSASAAPSAAYGTIQRDHHGFRCAESLFGLLRSACDRQLHKFSLAKTTVQFWRVARARRRRHAFRSLADLCSMSPVIPRAALLPATIPVDGVQRRIAYRSSDMPICVYPTD